MSNKKTTREQFKEMVTYLMEEGTDNSIIEGYVDTFMSIHSEQTLALDIQAEKLKESQEELERVKEGIPFIFEKGANALYGTISSETGNCNDIPLFNKLKKEAIEQLLNK